MKSGFLDKLIARLDRVEPGEVQSLVTRLVRENGFFESVFESLQEGLFITDLDGNITYINHSAGRLFGLNTTQCVGQQIDATIRGLSWSKLADPKKVVSRDMEIFYPEHRLLNFYLAPILHEIEDESRSQSLGFLLLVRDITNSSKEAEAMMESEKLNALTLLAAGVAHEIGNPLNSLGIHLQLMSRKIRKLPDEVAAGLNEHLVTAQAEIARLDNILKEFLQAIRPTAPKREPKQLHEILRSTLSVIEPELKQRNVQVALEMADSLPLLELDSEQIQQAIYNLIRNAAQALPADGGIITISSQLNDYDVTLSIQDEGSGIPPEVMGSIFEPYHSTKESGSGLGLLIVRRILREHGGEIEIESQEGVGSKVKLYFPLNEPGMRMLESSSDSIIEVEPIQPNSPS